MRMVALEADGSPRLADCAVAALTLCRFWLKGEERTEVVIPGETRESLKEQYERWRQMAELKAADEKKPRCEKRGLP